MNTQALVNEFLGAWLNGTAGLPAEAQLSALQVMLCEFIDQNFILRGKERCERCGCTEDNACSALRSDESGPDGTAVVERCHWVRPGLCSACATPVERCEALGIVVP